MPKAPAKPGGFRMEGNRVDDNPALRQAAQIVDTAASHDKADVVAAYYLRLRNHKVPEPAAREFTCLEFYSHDIEWDDDQP